ncbi:hypothetical protein Q5752_003849 [Cryptotrichosporon argae]
MAQTTAPAAAAAAAADTPAWHAEVAQRIRQNFDAVEQGDTEALVANWADECTHRFNGTHALGGTRTGKPAVAAWYARMARLMPGAKFDLTDYWITGTPDDIKAVIRWDMAMPVPGGEPFRNHGLHYTRNVRGKCVEQDIVCDSGALATHLAEQAGRGVAEAAAAPITSA